jgi:GT2 family glycosyltransferase
VLVVDAFSTDGTYEILKSYGKKIALKQLSGNAPKAYNYAMKFIDSDLVAFTNADCVAGKGWIRELASKFSDSKIMAVAGLSANPPKVESKLQEVIGVELESRYREFGNKILRAPEMNLCVRTVALKRLKFNESFDVGYDTDFGYRLNKTYGFGSMTYDKKAVIYHYHRATWKALFKQQYKYAKTVPRIYMTNKDAKITGDNVSKSYMPVQIALLYGIIVSALALIFTPYALVSLYAFSVVLLGSYLILAAKLSNISNLSVMLCMFLSEISRGILG